MQAIFLNYVHLPKFNYVTESTKVFRWIKGDMSRTERGLCQRENSFVVRIEIKRSEVYS